MKRSIGILLVLVGIAFPLGCGGQSDPDNSANTSASNRSKLVAAGSNAVPPNEIVAMFFDSIRRGDKETTIKLITLAAREEIQRRGMIIDPPGSPEASYKIGEVIFSDQDRDVALVESLLIEPGVNGQPSQETEVVWEVRLEPEGWRISSFASDMGPDQQPELVDFENLEAVIADNTAIARNNNVAGNATPPATGIQPPPAMPPSGIAAPAPALNGFTMPDLPPQISQPPNTQFR